MDDFQKFLSKIPSINFEQFCKENNNRVFNAMSESEKEAFHRKAMQQGTFMNGNPLSAEKFDIKKVAKQIEEALPKGGYADNYFEDLFNGHPDSEKNLQ